MNVPPSMIDGTTADPQIARLFVLIAEALAIADDLGLSSVGIWLDRAQVGASEAATEAARVVSGQAPIAVCEAEA